VLAEYSPFSTDAIVRRRAWTIVALWYASMSAAFVRPLLPDVVLRAGNLAVWIAIVLAVCLWRTVHTASVGDAPTSRAGVAGVGSSRRLISPPAMRTRLVQRHEGHPHGRTSRATF
jgi:hypothetical protein